jgi:putative transposase
LFDFTYQIKRLRVLLRRKTPQLTSMRVETGIPEIKCLRFPRKCALKIRTCRKCIRDGGGTGRASRPFSITPLDIRNAIYTTNSVESLNGSLREIIKTRGGFANEEAALKSLFLALRQAAKKWTMPIHHWREALNHFTILWPERMPALEGVAS